MAKGRRKLRRKLIRKMRKGYLTPGERSELKDLDREVNELNRRTARDVGAGAAALALLGQTQAGQDMFGNIREGVEGFVDDRRAARDERLAAKAEEEAGATPPRMEFEEDDVDLPPGSEGTNVLDEAVVEGDELGSPREEEKKTKEAVEEVYKDTMEGRVRRQNEEAEFAEDLVRRGAGYERNQRRAMRKFGWNPETNQFLPTRKEAAADAAFDAAWEAVGTAPLEVDKIPPSEIESEMQSRGLMRPEMQPRSDLELMRIQMDNPMPLGGPMRQAAGPMAEEQRDIFLPEDINDLAGMDRVVRYPRVSQADGGIVDPAKRADRAHRRVQDTLMDLVEAEQSGKEKLADRLLSRYMRQWQKYDDLQSRVPFEGGLDYYPTPSPGQRGPIQPMEPYSSPEFDRQMEKYGKKMMDLEIDQADGGYAPFLRAMRDRMRKKYTRR